MGSWSDSWLFDYVCRSLLIVRLSYCEWRDSGFWAQRRDALVPFGGLLIGVSERENIDFRKMRPTDLQSDRTLQSFEKPHGIEIVGNP